MQIFIGLAYSQLNHSKKNSKNCYSYENPFSLSLLFILFSFDFSVFDVKAKNSTIKSIFRVVVKLNRCTFSMTTTQQPTLIWDTYPEGRMGGGYPPERSFYEESLLNRKLNDKFTYKNSSMLKTSDCDWAKYKDFLPTRTNIKTKSSIPLVQNHVGEIHYYCWILFFLRLIRTQILIFVEGRIRIHNPATINTVYLQGGFTRTNVLITGEKIRFSPGENPQGDKPLDSQRH